MKLGVVALAGTAAVLGLTGCGGGGGGGGGSLTPNALGYYGDIDARNTSFTTSGAASANIQVNGDDTVSVEITGGPYAGETALFHPDREGYSADIGDGAEAYMRLGHFNVDGTEDDPVVAVIAADTWNGDGTVMAFRSTDGMTDASDMPLSGSATYSGQHLGIAAIQRDDVYVTGGDFAAYVDFGAGQLAGAMDLGARDITFQATISGAEFSSNTNSIAYGNDSSSVDQANSHVDGAFYGSSAAGIAGTYQVDGAGYDTGLGVVGTFVGERD